MSKWEKFEKDCTEYLNHKFGKYAEFLHRGGSDSNVSDIHAETKTNKNFYIEAKHSPAQCGQFVVRCDIKNRIFKYSARKSVPINQYSQKIIDHMQQHFDDFCNASTAGKQIIMDNSEEIFAQWIIKKYTDNGTKYFIANNYIIFPVEDFTKYFEVSAVYRIKKSGSSNVGKKSAPVFSKLLSENEFAKYSITSIRIAENKVFVESSKNIHNEKFFYKGHEFMFSERESEYEIRKLSKTFNANVIFSVKLKKSIPAGISEERFIALLE